MNLRRLSLIAVCVTCASLAGLTLLGTEVHVDLERPAFATR
jgi:hypothetical protein